MAIIISRETMEKIIKLLLDDGQNYWIKINTEIPINQKTFFCECAKCRHAIGFKIEGFKDNEKIFEI